MNSLGYIIVNTVTQQHFSGYRYYNNRMNPHWNDGLIQKYDTMNSAVEASKELAEHFKLQCEVKRLYIA